MKMFARITIIVMFMAFACDRIDAVIPQRDFVERNTSYGMVRGYKIPFQIINETQMELEIFLGVPYAAPPIGIKRWTRPTEPAKWSGVRNTTDFGPCCQQRMGYMKKLFGKNYSATSEDCLYLNIYSPKNISEPDQSVAVMLWIHGGANRYSSGEEVDGRILAEQGVVVVTMNYRLGVIGYMSTDDSVSPGNYGLLDQVQAIKWVRNNIQFFGGDPDRITLFGNSAGGSHVGLHLFSPLTKGMLNGCIPQSGNPFSPWALYRPPLAMRPKTNQIARIFNCPTQTSQSLISCMRSHDAAALSAIKMSGNGFTGAFVPRIDNYYLTDTPEMLSLNGSFHSEVALMTGTVPDEVTDEYPNVPNITEGWSRRVKDGRMRDWSSKYQNNADYAYMAVLQQYDLPGDVWTQQRDLYIELRTDKEYIAPHNQHVTTHSPRQKQTFLYSFEYRMEHFPSPEWMGVTHMEEMYYIFGVPFWTRYECPWPCRNKHWNRVRNFTSTDENLSLIMMKMWANFAKHRTPMGDDSNFSFVWRPFNSSTEDYLRILAEPVSDNYYKYRRTTFWNRYFEDLLKRLDTERGTSTSTVPPGCQSTAAVLHVPMTSSLVMVAILYNMLNV